jgi:hypothetical protein
MMSGFPVFIFAGSCQCYTVDYSHGDDSEFGGVKACISVWLAPDCPSTIIAPLGGWLADISVAAFFASALAPDRCDDCLAPGC